MVKNKIILGLALFGLALVPAGAALANTVNVSVIVAGVASIEKVESEERDGAVIYTATVSTNSIKGYELYASSNGEDWTLIKTVDHYPTGDELKGNVKVSGGNVEFKTVAIQ